MEDRPRCIFHSNAWITVKKELFCARNKFLRRGKLCGLGFVHTLGSARNGTVQVCLENWNSQSCLSFLRDKLLYPSIFAGWNCRRCFSQDSFVSDVPSWKKGEVWVVFGCTWSRGGKTEITEQNPLSHKMCLAEWAKQLDWQSECSALTKPQLIMS